MPDPRFLRNMYEEEQKPLGFVEAAYREFNPLTGWTVPSGRDLTLGGFAGLVGGGAAQYAALSKLLRFVPHPAAKAAGIALPMLVGALGGARGFEERSPEGRAFDIGTGALLGSPLPGRLLRRLRGKKGAVPEAVEEVVPGPEVGQRPELSFPSGSEMAQVWRKMQEGTQRGVPRSRAIIPSETRAPGLEGPTLPPMRLPEFDVPGARPPVTQRPGRGFLDFPEAPTAPRRPYPVEGLVGATRALGAEARDPFLSRKVGGAPFIHSADYGRWQAWKRVADKPGTPLFEVPEGMVRWGEQAMVFGGQRLQRVMASINKAVGRARPGVEVTPEGVTPATVLISPPVIPEALTTHAFYPRLREMVSQAFTQNLENPALALSQADAFLASVISEVPPERAAKVIGSLASTLKRRGGVVDPETLFATVMRGFGKLPKIASKGRGGVKVADMQAAQAVRTAEQTTAPMRTIGSLLQEWTNPEQWGPALERMGFRPDSYSAVGLLARLSTQPELLQQPASMLPRIMAQLTAGIDAPIANALNRPGLERHLGYLFQERISPDMLRGLPDESLRAAVRSAEAMLSDGHSIARAADMAAMHLGAPNASRLLILAGRNAWKHAALTGDAVPVYLKALTAAFSRFGVTDQDIVRLAESVAAREGTQVENVLGYLAYKAGIPAASIDHKVAEQFLRQVQKTAGSDPAVAAIFQELQGVPQVTRRVGREAGEALEVTVDDLVPRPARMLEEEGLLEDSMDILEGIRGVGQQAEPLRAGPNIVQALENALAGAAERRVPRSRRMSLVTEVGRILQGPGDEEQKAVQAAEAIRRFTGVTRLARAE